jgi:SAM-dependent MidA family methyltransferase
MPQISTPDASARLRQIIGEAIRSAGGWLGFDAYMDLALYTHGLGYYANDLRKLGLMPGSGSDFVTAPELSPLFGRALAAQVAQALQQSGTDEVWEFGAGSGALAQQLLEALGARVRRYTIVDVSGALRARQQQTLQRFGAQVQWASELPAAIEGVVLGNEVLDAMPVQLLVRQAGVWHERGVALAGEHFAWQDRPTPLRPPVEIDGPHDYLTEIHPQAEAFMRTLAAHLRRGAAFFIDYGFPEAEYYHPQRHMGTVMCHRAHQSDPDPLVDVGLKDITAHVNFTGVALAAQEAGLSVLGYTSQGRFLLNCGIAQLMEQADLPARAQAHKLVMEHEMGELFKVIGLCAGEPWDALGFAAGDRTHTL